MYHWVHDMLQFFSTRNNWGRTYFTSGLAYRQAAWQWPPIRRPEKKGENDGGMSLATGCVGFLPPPWVQVSIVAIHMTLFRSAVPTRNFR